MPRLRDDGTWSRWARGRSPPRVLPRRRCSSRNSRRWLGFALVLAVGVAVKEIVTLVVVPYL